MLFHSPEFIFGFLPLCFVGFLLAHRFYGWQGALLWLAGASLAFYAQLGLAFAVLLTASIAFNYGVAQLLWRRRDDRGRAKTILFGGIAANLLLLGYFKYTNFLIDNINAALFTSISHLDIIFPIGISFYTFIQIGFLIEVYNRQINAIKFRHYFLFSCFFPYVTAGPLVLQKDMVHQFEDDRRAATDATMVAVGVTVFAIGLFKKLVLADGVAPYADAVFNGIAAGAAASAAVAWTGAVAYTLQLYFDFSAYCDMALGLGCMFGLRLPLNFNSPLKACSITDYWRRWHMTMTRFFTNYLYSPIAIGVMRRAARRRYRPLARFFGVVAAPVVITFVLAGVWHGAGWTFVVFGVIHGVAMAINHAWREARMPPLAPAAGWLATMAVVLVAHVFFRADSVATALDLLGCMAGYGDAAATPVQIDLDAALVWLAALAAIALGLPNVQETMHRHWYSSDPKPETSPIWWNWRPGLAWSCAVAVLAVVAIGSMTNDSVFLYYQF